MPPKTTRSVIARLSYRHAFGASAAASGDGNACLDAVTHVDEHGNARESAVFVVGQHVSALRTDELGEMRFVTGRQARGARTILATSLAPNRKVLAVCERPAAGAAAASAGAALDADADSQQQQHDANHQAHLSVYHVAKCVRLKTMAWTCPGDFVSCAFSADSRQIITIAGAPERAVVVWQWEKEKVALSVYPPGPGRISRVRGHASAKGVFTTSGPGHLKLWTVTDGELKAR